MHSSMTIQKYNHSTPAMENITNQLLFETMAVTFIIIGAFVVTKNSLDHVLWRPSAAMTVVVVGAGPVGLLAALIAAQSEHVSNVIVIEKRTRKHLLDDPHQLVFDATSLDFLKTIGVDFDNIEGCSSGLKGLKRTFYTRKGVFQDYLISILGFQLIPVEIRLKTKFGRDRVASLPGRTLVVVADGANGSSVSELGLRDTLVQHCCKAYGAVAAIERPNERQIPTPETRVNQLTFDLSAFYGTDASPPSTSTTETFHLKIFGSFRSRYLSLIVPKCDSNLVKILRTTLDHSVMRNIFRECFNHFKSREEGKLTEMSAQKHIKFSSQLFDVKAFSRSETVAYFDDADLCVCLEGEAARFFNFQSGKDINYTTPGLVSLKTFIAQFGSARNKDETVAALRHKMACNDQLTKKMIKLFNNHVYVSKQ